MGVARRPAVSLEAVSLGGEVAECYMAFYCLTWARASRLLAIRSERTGAIVLVSRVRLSGSTRFLRVCPEGV